MARTLTAGMIAEITAAQLRPIVLVHLAFDSDPLFVWDGLGTLTWDGDDYLGIGDLMAFSSVEETAEIRAAGLQMSLSGIPSALLSVALSEAYQGRAAYVYLGALDAAGAIVADPVLVFSGRMDVMTIDERGDTSTITMSVENKLVDLERPRLRRYTPEDQAIDWPAGVGSPDTERDAFFDQVAALQNREIIWKA
jgi:hypothetical protein